MKRLLNLSATALVCGLLSTGAMAHGSPGNSGVPGAGMGPGMMGGYGDFGRMHQLMEQMHRTDDWQSHYQLMQQHWQEMEEAIRDLQQNPAENCIPEQLRERDRALEQLYEQMREHRKQFDRFEGYGRGMR